MGIFKKKPKELNHLFTTCEDGYQVFKVRDALDRESICYKTVELMESNTEGEVRQVYNIYINEKDLTIAQEALKNIGKPTTTEMIKPLKDTGKHFLEHLGRHFLIHFIKSLFGGPPGI